MRQLRDSPVGVEAAKLVEGERQETYGDPMMNYQKFARCLEIDLDLSPGSVTRRQAIHVMISLKKCRDLTTPHRDNEVDICGYAHLLQMDREANELDEEDDF
jgi:hypothetical protein